MSPSCVAVASARVPSAARRRDARAFAATCTPLSLRLASTSRLLQAFVIYHADGCQETCFLLSDWYVIATDSFRGNSDCRAGKRLGIKEGFCGWPWPRNRHRGPASAFATLLLSTSSQALQLQSLSLTPTLFYWVVQNRHKSFLPANPYTALQNASLDRIHAVALLGSPLRRAGRHPRCPWSPP